MAGEIENLDASLKNYYPKKAFRTLLNEEVPFRDLMKKNPHKVGDGGIVKFLAAFDSPQNVGQIGDLQDLPDQAERTDAQHTIYPTLFAGTIRIGEVTKASADSNQSAFGDGELSRRFDEVTRDIAKRINIVYSGMAGDGAVGSIESEPAANQFKMLAADGGAWLMRNRVKFEARTGAVVSVTATRATDVNRETGVVTYSGADQTPTVADKVYLYGSYGVRNANGLRNLVGDLDISAENQGLSRTTYPKASAIVDKTSVADLRDLEEGLITRLCHRIWHETGRRPTHLFTNTGQVEKYAEYVLGDRRFPMMAGGSQDYKTGFKDLYHVWPGGTLKFEVNPDILPRELYVLTLDTFFHYESQPLGWWDRDGSILKPVPGTDGYKAGYMAAIRSVENIGCDASLANGVARHLRDNLAGDA
jgi:hypothetical protein